MKIRYLSHGSFLIDFHGKKLLIDPFFTGNPKAGVINPDEFNPDWILITHGHGDHIADVEEIAKRSKAKIISNYEFSRSYLSFRK